MLGLCCQYLETKIKKNGSSELINIVNEKGLQYNQYLKGKYPISQIEETWIHNANELLSILKRVNSENIKVFRVSSNLFPLYDSVTKELYNCSAVKNILKKLEDLL